MPYKIRKEDDQWCVYKDTGEKEGCSDSESKAEAHMRALYAAENKEKDEIDELVDLAFKEFYGEVISVSSFVTSYAELRDAREAEQMQIEIEDAIGQFPMLVRNIMMDESITDKSAAVNSLADELGSIIDQKTKENAEKAKWSTAYINDLPDSAFLYVESGEKDSEGKTTPRSKRHLPYKDKEGNIDLPHLRNAISRLGQSGTGTGWLSDSLRDKLQAKAQRILDNKKEAGFIDQVKQYMKENFPFLFKGDKEEDDNGMMIWKESDGQWKWITRYSNTFRDVDNPPEIISSTSHRRFVELVDKGLAPLPELWLWHVKDWKVGQATMVAYDEVSDGVGFAIATGHFLPGCEQVAEWLSKQNFRVSHGMPVSTIVRDDDDDSVIVQHETREISPLPAWVAANQLTSFVTMKEAHEMAIPTEKRTALIEEWGMKPELLDQIERLNSDDAAKAIEDNIEHKEVDDEPKVETPPVETPEAETDTEPVETEPEVETEEPEGEDKAREPSQDYPTRNEIAEAVANVLQPFVDRVNQLTKDLETVSEEIKQLKERQEEDFVQTVKSTPAASLSAILSERVIGNREAKVKDGDPIGDGKPKETDPNENKSGVHSIPFLHDMLSGQK